MSSQSQPSNSAETVSVARGRASRGLVKRALLGLVLLVTFVAGGACLLHATIEADGDSATASLRPAPDRQ
jgi:hypothetical protein